MSLLHLPDIVNSKSLQIWSNAAFDGAAGGSDVAAAKLPWSPLQPISTNQSESLDLYPSKENRSPSAVFDETPVSKKSSTALKPPGGGLIVVSGKASKVSFKEDSQIDDESIDGEIDVIEKEIKRLSSRLEALRIKKAERDSRAAGRRGRIVPAKFMDPKQGAAKILETPGSKKIERAPASAKLRQRGGSLGPLEIIAGSPKVVDLRQSSTKNLGSSSALKKIEESPASARLHRRGVSLGPLEIRDSVTSQQLGAPEGTPLRSAQSHKKQGFRKLEGIQESKGERSWSPKSRPSTAAQTSATRKGATATIATKKVAESPANARLQRRGVSLGPSEILCTSARSRQPSKIQEVKVMKAEKGRRSSSISPKSRRPTVAAKVSELRKGIMTVGAKKPVKKEERSLTSLKPKTLFQDAKNAIPARRPSKNSKGRVVASRYSLATARGAADEPGSKRREWPLLESGMDETNRSLRGSSGSEHESQDMELDEQMEGEWEMPSKVEGNEDNSLSGDEKSPSSIMLPKIAELLPKIKTVRCITESPRDSGCAKRVAELVGRRPAFGEEDDEEDVTSPCQALNFEEEAYSVA